MKSESFYVSPLTATKYINNNNNKTAATHEFPLRSTTVLINPAHGNTGIQISR